MLTALSVARTCSIVGDQDRVIMVSVVPSGDENEHNILYCPVKNTSNLKSHTNGETVSCSTKFYILIIFQSAH